MGIQLVEKEIQVTKLIPKRHTITLKILESKNVFLKINVCDNLYEKRI